MERTCRDPCRDSGLGQRCQRLAATAKLRPGWTATRTADSSSATPSRPGSCVRRVCGPWACRDGRLSVADCRGAAWMCD